MDSESGHDGPVLIGLAQTGRLVGKRLDKLIVISVQRSDLQRAPLLPSLPLSSKEKRGLRLGEEASHN